jgi:hypothetical protein
MGHLPVTVLLTTLILGNGSPACGVAIRGLVVRDVVNEVLGSAGITGSATCSSLREDTLAPEE